MLPQLIYYINISKKYQQCVYIYKLFHNIVTKYASHIIFSKNIPDFV